MALSKQIAAALERGAEQGSWVSARSALAPLDPLVRLVASRRLGRLLERARRETTLDDPAHVLRVAALLALNSAPETPLDDPAAVETELARLGPRAVEKQRPWWTLGALGMLVFSAAAIWLVSSALAPFDARATLPGKLLGGALTDFVHALDGRPESADDLADARAQLTGRGAGRAFGEDGAAVLKRVLAAAERTARSPASADGRPGRDAFLSAATDFGVVLRQKQLPFFVDADVLASGEALRPILMSSYVEREVEVEAAGHRVRALHLWRLDGLALRLGALGYTRARTPAALVLLDQVEEDLVRWVLPALPAGQSMELVGAENTVEPEPWVVEVERRAAEVLRRHYAPFRNDRAVARVGELLSRRRALVRKWSASLSGQGLTLRVPERLVPERDYAAELEIRITRANLREWDELHAELLGPESLAAFARLRERYTLAIERHEIQHRLDFARGFTPLPELVARLLGLENDLDLPEGGLAASTRHEFSAYLAQLAQGADSPLLDLVLMARLALNQASRGGPHSIAAVAVLLAVGKNLDIDSDAYLARGFTRPRVAELLLAVTAHEPGRIRAAALSAYAQSFGQPLPAVRRVAARENPAWRH